MLGDEGKERRKLGDNAKGSDDSGISLVTEKENRERGKEETKNKAIQCQVK